MPNELDAYTKRPRTPNDPYTLLTDEQIRNIKQNASSFFHLEGKKPPRPPTLPRQGRNYAKERYGHLYIAGLNLERTCDETCSDVQTRPYDISRFHDTFLDTAADQLPTT